jgi:hypothetical protein
MKRNVLVLLLVSFIVLIGVWKLVYKESAKSPVQIPSNGVQYCSSSDLQALLSLDHAAGNVYGTFTLKNISGYSCQVLGGQFIQANYTSSNTKVVHVGQTPSQSFELAPGQTIYSQVHYPNGPQCSSSVTPINVTFTYSVSPTESVTFRDQSGKAEQSVQACTSQQDITEIQVWNMSPQPITVNQ